MFAKDDTSPLETSESTLDIDVIIASFNGDPELKDALHAATVLIVPTDLSPEYERPAFPNSTKDVYHLLREALGDRATVEALVCDDDYAEFAYHSEQLILPNLYIVDNVVLPLVISLLASYLFDLLKTRGDQNDDHKVKSEIHFVDRNGTQLSFKYDGPAVTYEQVMMQTFQDLDLSTEKSEPPKTNTTNHCS